MNTSKHSSKEELLAEIHRLNNLIKEVRYLSPQHLKFAHDDLIKLKDGFKGSAVLVTVTALNGNVLTSFGVNDGLSSDTIDNLCSDIKRTYDYQTEFKIN